MTLLRRQLCRNRSDYYNFIPMSHADSELRLPMFSGKGIPAPLPGIVEGRNSLPCRR
jgi:hypothetical protein